MTDTTAQATPSVSAVSRALVYGDVNLNLIDGSAIWAASVVEVLALAGCDVTLLLKSRVTTSRLLAPLTTLPNVKIVRPFEEGLAQDLPRGVLSPTRAVRLLRDLDARDPFDLIVVRGIRVLERLVDDGGFDGRIWSYLTDVPQNLAEVTAQTTETLGRIAVASQLILCQTEELRGFIESTIPASAGKCVLFPPILPAVAHDIATEARPHQPLRLAYAGKFAPLWNTEAMTRLPAQLKARGIAAELHMIGDKIQGDPNDPRYVRRMEKALRSSPGVIWHRGMPREEAIALVASCDIGLSWRDRVLDASLELSTKVLEYGAVGLPVVLNRTPMHEALLGVDYPLFVDPGGDAIDAIEAATDVATFRLAAQRCQASVEAFTPQRAVERVRHLLASMRPMVPALATRARPLRIAVASHDLKFFSRLLERFESMPQLDVRVDAWPAIDRHDPEQSRALLDWADVVICEWCGPNAVWYAKHKRPDQRLLVRLHRFELYRPWPEQLAIDQVDRVICVSPSYAQLTLARTGWPSDKVTVIPNWVDVEQLDRPKLPGARFHLGMIGVGESRKRLDIALDVLEAVRRDDDRFMLFAKTKMPWEYSWIWRRPGEAEHSQATLRRIQGDPLLRGSVVFDRFGPNVGAWLRGIGFVLSTSDDESFHLSPAEGMASGAVPVIRNWPGAETIFDPMWIQPDAAGMADAILATVQDERWEAAGNAARDQVRASYSLERVITEWTELIVDRAPVG
jgi:glycosyltransferase involved in cell wall biosynthesis